jgi:hypothetical protein
MLNEEEENRGAKAKINVNKDAEYLDDAVFYERCIKNGK